jgi:hypothetical protein
MCLELLFIFLVGVGFELRDLRVQSRHYQLMGS